MEIRKLQYEGNELEFEVLNENETLLNPIKQRLLAHEDVDLAEYVIEHPSLAVPRIFLRTKKGDPLKVLRQVLKDLQKEYKDLAKLIEEQAPAK